MMASKPQVKPEGEDCDDISVTSMEPDSFTKEAIPTNHREKDLERRLALLGDSEDVSPVQDDTKVKEEIEEEVVPVTEEVPEQKNPVVSEVKSEPTTITVQSSEEKLKDDTPPKSMSAAAKKKEALLARIMAAQNRAKQAQQKKQDPSILAEKDKMMKALNGFEKDVKIQAPKTETLPPPPSFEVAQQQHQTFPTPPLPPQEAVSKSVQAPLPPSFDAVEKQILLQKFDPSAPSAPPIEEKIVPPSTHLDYLQSEMSVVAPPASNDAPPPFEVAEQQQVEDETFEFDMEGNNLSPAERQKMIEEQRAILEQISKQKNQNEASEVAARAAMFDMRSNTAAAQVAGANDTPAAASSTSQVANSGIVVGDENNASTRATVEEETSRRFVEIGGGQKVALHGQDKTREAINDGTAMLVQCLNCENWMQITESATLMYCPVCSVVSPVIKQTEIMTKDEAIQLMEDRKLAEKLQNEMYVEEGDDSGAGLAGYPAVRRGAESAESATDSWWNSISSMVSTGATDEANTRHSAEINVRQTQASTNSGRRVLLGANTGTSNVDQEEHEGLLSSGSATRSSRPSARVAERQPFFSCLVDSVSSTANALGTAFNTETTGEESNVHGIDTSSLLTVTNAGRDNRDSRGSYRPVSEN
eukprot:CAMPEP_0184857758 /NCGR_PEP_ID=MMETSP0580-20130426/2905_1 /TAXON_ID=1118495 /ORGANISM="Dactyliosolen fragilissimus" /LENGTH=644 /DNA_ID=CAMNT_0027353535 /DNA_START=149 /DNA_END=2086 /DNA_ORIENTATION=+